LRARSVCGCESANVHVSLNLSVCSGARVRLLAQICGSVPEDVCLRVCSCECLCAHLCSCAGACARTCLRMRVFVCTCECVWPFHRQASPLVCVCACGSNDCARMPRRLCGRCGGTAGTGGINSSAGGFACVVAVRCDRPGYVRLGRRCHLADPHSQGGMGWPI
jgi:hypothetical protein